jgi:hypothetical protein
MEKTGQFVQNTSSDIGMLQQVQIWITDFGVLWAVN